MNRRLTCLAAVLAIATGTARADFHVVLGGSSALATAPLPVQPIPAFTDSTFSSAAPTRHAIDSLAGILTGTGGDGDLSLLSARMGAITVSPDVRPAEVIREIPALPGSAAMFLSGVLSMGGWYLLRSSVKHLNFGALPEWYHTGGPAQVGHAVPFDFQLTSLTLCSFEPADAGANDRGGGDCVGADVYPRCAPQWSITLNAPRGPPVLS